MKRLAIAVLLVLGLGVFLLLRWLQPERVVEPAAPHPAGSALLEQVERGRYLAIVGDCMPCHTARGEAPYAGGREIPTPFGTFLSPNITPDRDTGIGAWSADDFWRALHDGRSRDGSPLYPVFPYTNYTRVTRADSDALYSYLRTLAPVARRSQPHRLKFPYRYRAMLLGWRALYFRPGVYEPDASRDDAWNRGAYLAQGLGHCSACHEARNALGGVQSKDNPAGGLVLSWYAPSLHSVREAGVQGWETQEIAQLLRDGKSAHGAALGPMAEVVYESLQHWSDADLGAIASYLSSLPEQGAPAATSFAPPGQQLAQRLAQAGEPLYAEHCRDCHGAEGEGVPPGGPPLAGNRAVTLGSALNPIRVLLYGGYAPGTAGNPRPFGMPPFGDRLTDEEIAAVLTHVRSAWGNEAAAVSPAEVARHRGGPLW